MALSGAPPDREIPSLTLINGYTARLVNQNELNLREVWLRTELFGQRLAIVAGRVDLTNYFDRNSAANDETTQFISDALVNNQMLGLASNGTGFVADYDTKGAFSFRFGLQQSNPDATSLSDSIYSLSEVGYTLTPFSSLRGTIGSGSGPTTGTLIEACVGVSLDQKLTDPDRLWTLRSAGPASRSRPLRQRGRVVCRTASCSIQGIAGGSGYAHMDLAAGDTENLAEGYYNLQLTGRLRLSFTLQGVLRRQTG